MVEYLIDHKDDKGHQLLNPSKKIAYYSKIDQLFPEDESSNFATYNKALNWIMHTFGKDVTYGFADNVWAGDVLSLIHI